MDAIAMAFQHSFQVHQAYVMQGKLVSAWLLNIWNARSHQALLAGKMV